MLGTREQALDFMSARVNEKSVDMDGLLIDLFDLCGSWAVDNPLVDDDDVKSAIVQNTWRLSITEQLNDDDDPEVGIVSGVQWKIVTMANNDPIDEGFVPTKDDDWESVVISDLRDNDWGVDSIDPDVDNIVVLDLS